MQTKWNVFVSEQKGIVMVEDRGQGLLLSSRLFPGALYVGSVLMEEVDLEPIVHPVEPGFFEPIVYLKDAHYDNFPFPVEVANEILYAAGTDVRVIAGI
ncbi:MAG: hypothetical protein ACOY9Y_07580 [Bacillota bacterium]